MLRFYANKYVSLSRRLEAVLSRSDTQRLVDLNTSVSEEDRKVWGASLASFKKGFEELSLGFCVLHIDGTVRLLNTKDDLTYRELHAALRELQSRLEHELSINVYFQLNSERIKYYEQEQPLFGQTVSDKFPSALYDIVEAGRCLATERSTACVFHLMRIMEAGLKALAKKLTLSIDPDWTWQKILNEVNAAINRMPEKPPKKKRLKESFASMSAHLSSVKMAWRNPTMHVRGKYAMEEAEAILNNVRIFIQHLCVLL